MSVREFAAHLGVSDRMVSKWEAGGVAIRPRPVNQAALDTSLAQSSPEIRTRFGATLHGRSQEILRHRIESNATRVTHLVRHPDDGKLMTLVEAGASGIGVDVKPVWIAGFYLDVYPTSNADYAGFVAATGYRPPAYWGQKEPPADLLDHPVVEVSWADASAYAVWAAKVLPTGPEWEKAARGPVGSLYPWGEHPGPARANVRESRIGGTTQVDRYDNGLSPYGVYDLCGNVWEWCATPRGAGRREVRGGGFATSMHQAVPARPQPRPEQAAERDVGFRCAVALDAMLQLLRI